MLARAGCGLAIRLRTSAPALLPRARGLRFSEFLGDCVDVGCFPARADCGHGWYKTVSTDALPPRAIIHSAINGITFRTAYGETGFCHDHEEPLASALRRNGSRKRAGLAAARAIMSGKIRKA
ncbi:hypothetical protein EBZ80_10460 [bacterium]|nr:hypothetical protein [bacterium]